MTSWVRSDAQGAWLADLGIITFDPALPAVSVMPPASVCAQVDYLVYADAPGLFADVTSGAVAYGAAYFDPYRYWVGALTSTATGTNDNRDSYGTVPTRRLIVAWFDPDYALGDTAPTVAPETLAPSDPDAPPAPPAAEPPPALSLYDTDGTFLTDLPLATGRQYQEELSAAGAISFRLPLDDAATVLVTAGRIVKVYWRGQFRQAARVGASSTTVAADGRAWREWSNLPGIMSILSGVTVYPEYGLNRAGNGSRTWGYMARTAHGEWLSSGNWTPAIGVTWAAMTGDRTGKPEGVELPNPQWIAKRGPNADEPPWSYQYFRRRWVSAAAADVRILATGDNYIDLWLDGEHIVDSAGQRQFTWRDAFEIRLRLPAGLHVMAARVRNHRDTTYTINRMGFLMTMQRMQPNGDPFDEAPLLNTDSEWLVSDVTPGFRRAEVLHSVWAEGVLYGYGACTLIPLGFTRTVDSDGNNFDETPGEYTLDVGWSVLDALAAFTEKEVDVNVDPDTLELRMWNRRGIDRSATVQLLRGIDGGNLIGHGVDRTEPRYNTLLMQLGDGQWAQRQDVAAVAARGREGGGLAMGSTTSRATANATADAQLLEASQGTAAFTTQVSTLVGPQVYTDFGLGDTVTVPDENGTGVYAARVMAVTVEVPDDGSPVRVTPELMLDRSATPIVTGDGGAGSEDPGDIGASDGGTGGSTSGGGSGGPISDGGTDVAYDWTANPYGSAYDAAGGSGGYIPDDTHAGVPSGSSFAETVTSTGGFLTINTAATAKGTGSASAATNKVTLTGHGMPNGHPVYFSTLSSDGAGLAAGVAGWCVVANSTANTFQLKRANEATGVFSTVNITADYSAVGVMAGVWHDQVDFSCHITIASSATGLLLLTRPKNRGPAAALSPTGATPAQGLIYNLSNAWVLVADGDAIPDAPVAKLDAFYGKNFRVWRTRWKHVIDGIGSHGNNVFYGCYATDAAWFYPDPEHSNGSHCDLGMQVFGNAKHRMVGCHVDGLVASSVSSTSDPSGHPIPATANTVLQVNHAAGLAAPTDVSWDKCLLGGGGYTINVDGREDRVNLGRVNGRFKRNNLYHATSAIAAPSPGAKVGGATIHYDTSGCVYDDDRSTVVPYVAPGTDGSASHLVWP